MSGSLLLDVLFCSLHKIGWQCRAVHGRTLAFKNPLRMRSCDLYPRGQGLRSGPLPSANAGLCIALLNPPIGGANTEFFGKQGFLRA